MSDNYTQALIELKDLEGRYSNSASDPGGETWCGIARNYWKTLDLWKIVDRYKAKFGGPTKACIAAMSADGQLTQMVRDFYKKYFWDVWGADNLQYPLALELFEQSINLGVGGCTYNLQRVLKCLNASTDGPYRYDKDLDVDGAYDNTTRTWFMTAAQAGCSDILRLGLNGEQYIHYRESTENNKSRRIYYKGWVRARCKAKRYLELIDKPVTDVNPKVSIVDANDVALLNQLVDSLTNKAKSTSSADLTTVLTILSSAMTYLQRFSTSSTSGSTATTTSALSNTDCQQDPYWTKYGCSSLPKSLAVELITQTADLTEKVCVTNLQRVLNAMNYTTNKGIYGYGKDLKPDGIFGNNTRGRLELMVKEGYGETVQYGLNGEQYAYYRDRALVDKTKRMEYIHKVNTECFAEFDK